MKVSLKDKNLGTLSLAKVAQMYSLNYMSAGFVGRHVNTEFYQQGTPIFHFF